MDSLELTSFMHKHGVTDLNDGLTKIVNHINALAPQLPTGFGDDAHKTRYLRRAVLGHSFAQQPIAQITSARYTFTQFQTALKESLQLREELSRARAPDMNYGQYVRDPRDVRPSNSRWPPNRSYLNQGIIVTVHDHPFDPTCVTVHAAHTAPDAMRVTTIVTIAASIQMSATRKFAGVVVHPITY